MTAVYVPVRVEDPSTGHQFTTTSVHAESAGLKVLDKATRDKNGRSIPARPRRSKAGRSAPRKAAPAVDLEKENDR